MAAVVVLRLDVGPLPSKQFAPPANPTKSITFELGKGHVETGNVAPDLVNATLPKLEISKLAVRSGVMGSGPPLLLPVAN